MSALRIAYVCRYDPYASDGVVRKITSQVKAWRRDGVDVELFVASKKHDVDPSHAPGLAGRHFLYGPPLEKLRMNLSLQRAVIDWEPDVVYLRYSTFLPPPVRLVRSVPTVVEINSDDRAEYRLVTRSQRLFNWANRRLILGRARGMACVTPELAAQMQRDYPRARTIAIANGVEPIEGQPPPVPRHARPRLVLLASQPQPWHGIDKIVSLAGDLTEFDFDIVCPLEGDGEVPSNVRLHGYLDAESYRAVLAEADVALAGLAFHRIGLSQATPLKVREYLLHGLPLIVGYDDPDLSGDPWFVLGLPNCEGNVAESHQAIRDFVHDTRGRRVAREEVLDRIGVAAKEKKRLRFLAEIAASR